MKNCDVRTALSVLYYLILVDGQSQEHELSLFEQLGEQFDAAKFKKYKEQIITECDSQIAGAIDDSERYDLVVEGVDKALAHKAHGDTTLIPITMLLWDMLAISHADGARSLDEERLIRHVVRVQKINQNTYKQFIYIMNACVSIEKQRIAIENSSMNYSQAKPLIDELEHRRNVLVLGVQDIISDTRLPVVPKAEQVEEDIVDKGIRNAGELVNEAGKAMNEAGKAIGQAAGQAGEALGNVGNQVQKNANEAWNNVANTVGGWFKR